MHHSGFGEIATEGGALLLRELRRAGHTAGLVVDLGCGSGILARALTDAGYDVLGVDLSPDMLRLAARTAPAATFVQGSLLDATLPPCVGVSAVGETVNYAFDRRAGAASLGRVLRRVHRALVPGGVFLLDVAGPGRAGRAGRTEVWRDGGDWALHSEATEDPASGTLVREITLFRRVGRTWRRSDERHVLRLHSPRDVEAALRGAGFTVRVRRSYGSVRLPGWRVFVARR